MRFSEVLNIIASIKQNQKENVFYLVKISENIDNEDYFVSALIKHHLTGSIELISLQSLKKYYS